jgi:hypothetical protein
MAAFGSSLFSTARTCASTLLFVCQRIRPVFLTAGDFGVDFVILTCEEDLIDLLLHLSSLPSQIFNRLRLSYSLHILVEFYIVLV